jgi:hypothetical protein
MRRIITMLVAAGLSTSVAAGVALAAPSPNAESTYVYTDTIDLFLPAGACPALPDDLSIQFAGTVRGHLHVSVDASGAVHVNWPDSIFGTAVDSDGATYQFHYHNVAIWTEDEIPFEVTVTDHFSLVGNGAANQLHSFYVQRLLVTEDAVEVLFESAHGECDPL